MANSIDIYKNKPTVNQIDGAPVSTGGSFSLPLSFTLAANKNDSKILKCAIRAYSDFRTIGATTIAAENDTNHRLTFCKTEDGTFTGSITFDEPITDVNTIFYAKATSGEDENPQTDRSISIKVTCCAISEG